MNAEKDLMPCHSLQTILLSCCGLSVTFETLDGAFRAVDDISFEIEKGQVVGVVGESGCGKSMMALALLGLVPEPGYISNGKIDFEGVDLRKKTEREMQAIRGDRISMIFQEPMTSLNPVFKIGRQVSEALRLHRSISRQEARDRAVEALKTVGIPAPEKRYSEYPHQLSGGMRQRAMIAMAMCCKPKLLIADEPTTALDVTIQAQILELMKELVRESMTSVLFITHDLGVVAEMCDRVLVMYAGNIIETAGIVTIFENPLHPYTTGLLKSIPRVDDTAGELSIIPGTVPSLEDLLATGCRFEPRCARRMTVCKTLKPKLVRLDGRHWVSCHLYGDRLS